MSSESSLSHVERQKKIQIITNHAKIWNYENLMRLMCQSCNRFPTLIRNCDGDEKRAIELRDSIEKSMCAVHYDFTFCEKHDNAIAETTKLLYKDEIENLSLSSQGTQREQNSFYRECGTCAKTKTEVLDSIAPPLSVEAANKHKPKTKKQRTKELALEAVFASLPELRNNDPLCIKYSDELEGRLILSNDISDFNNYLLDWCQAKQRVKDHEDCLRYRAKKIRDSLSQEEKESGKGHIPILAMTSYRRMERATWVRLMRATCVAVCHMRVAYDVKTSVDVDADDEDGTPEYRAAMRQAMLGIQSMKLKGMQRTKFESDIESWLDEVSSAIGIRSNLSAANGFVMSVVVCPFHNISIDGSVPRTVLGHFIPIRGNIKAGLYNPTCMCCLSTGSIKPTSSKTEKERKVKAEAERAMMQTD